MAESNWKDSIVAKSRPEQLQLLETFYSHSDLRRLGTAWCRHREGFPPSPDDGDLVDLMRQHEDLRADWDALMMSEAGKGKLKVPPRLAGPLFRILMEATLKESLAANKPPWIGRLYEELTLGGLKEVDTLSALMWALAKERIRSKRRRTRVRPKDVELTSRRSAKGNQLTKIGVS